LRRQNEWVLTSVPTPDVSIVDLTAVLGKEVTKAEINAAMKKAAEGELKASSNTPKTQS
jgi:glyceraldehyde-3-phosphate dehydrogenase/erythrose-4-phosphate dehydrogenase